MTQHLLLVLVSAPLLVLSQPYAAFAWALPGRWRPALARKGLRRGKLPRSLAFLVLPLFAWSFHASTLWLWHAPALYEWALRNDTAHALEHAFFFGSGLLFWWTLVHGPGRALSYGASALFVFTMALQSTLLAALITFADAPWYPSYSGTTAAWGLTQLADQQLAGGIMWVPAGMIYLSAGLALIVAWMRAIEKRVAARESQVAASGQQASWPPALAGEGENRP
jgi:cytochrome c oxidase assembly factor CtaG